jgi:hypothetical protein
VRRDAAAHGTGLQWTTPLSAALGFDNARLAAFLRTLEAHGVGGVRLGAALRFPRGSNWIRRRAILDTAEPVYVAR